MQCLVSLWCKCFVLLLLVVTTWTARTGPIKAPKVAHPDYSVYHTKDGVFRAFQDTVKECSSFMKLTELTEGDASYNTTLSVVTVEPGGLTDDHSGKIRLLLDFGEHGRELISPEIALRLLRMLCAGGSDLAALAAKSGVGAQELQGVLERSVLQVIPMENVRGRERVEGGALCERKNGRGVDPNRNWDVHWGHKEADYDPGEEFPGQGPFSEPEALLLKQLASQFKPHVWLNVHSGMEALFMPYDHQPRIPEGASANATLELLEKLNKSVCGGRCAVGSGGKAVGYLAHGTATDYMYDKLGVPISMTWEVYGDMNASYHDCFRMFNPLSAEAFNSTVDTWASGVLGLLALLPAHPDIPAPPPSEAGLVGRSARQAQQAERLRQQAEEGGESAGRRGGVALELEAEEQQAQQQQAQQAEQQQQLEQGGSGGGTGQHEQQGGGGGADGGSGSGSTGNGNGAKQEKAAQIAAALLGHHADVADSSLSGLGGVGAGGSGAGLAAAAGRGWRHPRLHPPATRADWEAVGLFLAAVGFILGAYVLYSKPQVRYALSRWGLVTRRSDIPL